MKPFLSMVGLPWSGVASLAAIACLALAGCGSGVRTVPVVGKVTFGGNPPPYGCVLNFLPLRDGATADGGEVAARGLANGCGECDSSGAFKAVCLRNRSGLMPGCYQVMVSCFVPNETPNAPPVSVVPADFTPPHLVVPADARSVRYDLDVPARKK